MKLITLWEPWATLMAIGEKRIETRGWHTQYRGLVAIHSAKGGLRQGDLLRTSLDEPFRSCLILKSPAFAVWAEKWRRSSPSVLSAFHCGHIIAVGILSDCLRSESYLCSPGVFDDYPNLDTPQERAFGNYEPGRYGLVFENIRLLPSPVPFKSRQGKLLDLDAKTALEVLGQL